MYFNTKDISIYYEKYGHETNTILILPGWGDTRETFTNIINFFQEDYTIYIIDYPGFGNSKIPTKTLTIFDYAKNIKAFMKELNIKKPIIIAHSFGGRIVSILSSLKVQIEKIVLIDVAGIKRKKSPKQYLKEKLYKVLKRLVKLSKNKDKLQQKLRKKFSSADYQTLPPNMHQTFKNIINEDLTPYYKNISCECLILWGKLDDATPLKDGYKIKRLIKDSALIIYPQGNHFPYLQYPILTNNILKSFFKDN